MYTRIMEISPWTLRSAKLEKEHKRLQESLTSLGNGYMGMRGSFEETYSADSHLGTYIAGVWFPDKTRVGWWKNGYPKYFGKAINALNFSKVKIFVDGQEVDLAKNDVAGFSVELDMQHGVLRRSFTVFGVRFDVCKFLSVAQKELAVIRWEAVSVDGKTHQVRIDSIIDADVKNETPTTKKNSGRYWTKAFQTVSPTLPPKPSPIPSAWNNLSSTPSKLSPAASKPSAAAKPTGRSPILSSPKSAARPKPLKNA